MQFMRKLITMKYISRKTIILRIPLSMKENDDFFHAY